MTVIIPQQHALTAPAMWVGNESSLPYVNHGHCAALDHDTGGVP